MATCVEARAAPLIATSGFLSDEPQSTCSSDDEPPIRRSRTLRPAISPLVPIVGPNGARSAYYPSISPSLSRRSSSAGSAFSACSSKSVHFQSAETLTSVWHTYSPDQYDRSPIIPSGDDLEIPSCKNATEGGWIKCLRRKAKEAAAEGVAPPFISAVFNQPVLKPSQTALSSPDIDGLPLGSSPSGIPLSFTSTAPDHLIPVLSTDESSCSSESSDFEHHLSPMPTDDAELSTTPTPAPLGKHHRTASMELCLSLAFDDTKVKPQWHGEMSEDVVEDDDDDGEQGEDEQDEDEDDEPEPRQRGLGMCSLGKFTRSSLYSSDDALGGCELFAPFQSMQLDSDIPFSQSKLCIIRLLARSLGSMERPGRS